MERAVVLGMLADAVLILHVGVVLFVIGGVVLILAGNLGRRRWAWVNRPGFRFLHAAAIGVVAAQAWLGVVCPLTTLEMWLRAQAGQLTYRGSFVEHWLHAVLYFEAPHWVFTLAYSLFGLLVVAVWLRFPPARRTGHAAA